MAIVTNSGCANACTGPQGVADAKEMAQLTARALGCSEDHVLVASTGVIGVNLKMEKVTPGIRTAVAQLARGKGSDVALAIMTTDPFPKETAVKVETAAGTFDAVHAAGPQALFRACAAVPLASSRGRPATARSARWRCSPRSAAGVPPGPPVAPPVPVRRTPAHLREHLGAPDRAPGVLPASPLHPRQLPGARFRHASAGRYRRAPGARRSTGPISPASPKATRRASSLPSVEAPGTSTIAGSAPRMAGLSGVACRS